MKCSGNFVNGSSDCKEMKKSPLEYLHKRVMFSFEPYMRYKRMRTILLNYINLLKYLLKIEFNYDNPILCFNI